MTREEIQSKMVNIDDEIDCLMEEKRDLVSQLNELENYNKPKFGDVVRFVGDNAIRVIVKDSKGELAAADYDGTIVGSAGFVVNAYKNGTYEVQFNVFES